VQDERAVGIGGKKYPPRQSVRISARTAQVGNTSLSIVGMNSTTIFYGDINNCNSCFRDSESMVEPSKLWEIGKQIGIICRGDEDEVAAEYQCMEEKESEVMKSFEEGNKNGLLC